MPASFAAYDRARSCLIPIRGEDAVILSPAQPHRLLREVFQVLLAHGGLTRETRRHLVHAFGVALEPKMERRIVAALSERWDGDLARGLSEALQDVLPEQCPIDRGCRLTAEHTGPCMGAFEASEAVAV